MSTLSESVDPDVIGKQFEALAQDALSTAFQSTNVKILRGEDRQYQPELTPEINIQYGLPPSFDRILFRMRYQERGQKTGIESNNEVFFKNTRHYTVVMGPSEIREDRVAYAEYWTANDSLAFKQAVNEGIQVLDKIFTRDISNQIPGWESSPTLAVRTEQVFPGLKFIESDGDRQLLSCFSTGISACYVSAPDQFVLSNEEAFPDNIGSPSD